MEFPSGAPIGCVDSASGTGDMEKAVYDTGDNGACDVADDVTCTGCVADAELASTFLKNIVEDLSPQLGAGLDAQTFDITNVGEVQTDTLTLDGRTAQSITAASDTISISGSYIALTPDADYIMTSTPTITNPTKAQVLILHNESSTFGLTLQDNSILAGSDVDIAGANPFLGPDEVMILYFDATDGIWHILSHPNSVSTIAGNPATVPVRNTSGSTLNIGDPVYITGYNAGQARVTVDLADADDSAKYPAIGLMPTSLGNNQNGVVQVSGFLTGYDTSLLNVNDPLYLSTTAGALTTTRPTGATDCVQAVGRVARANASGVVQVIGAGRCNDESNSIDPDRLTNDVGDNDLIDHEIGGLEANVSAYGGLVGINGGSTLDVNTCAEVATALTGATTGTCGSVVLSTSPTFTGTPAAPTAAVDTNTTQISTTAFVQQEINGAGGRSLTCSGGSCDADAELYTWTLDKTIEAPTSADNFIIQAYVPLASTVTKIQCIVENATSATIRIDECDSDGDNCAGIDGATTIVCDVDGQADDGTLSNAGIDVGDTLRAVVTATSGTPGHVAITVMGTRND